MGIISYQGNKFNRQQENNVIFNSAVDEILLHETKKVSAAKEAPEVFEYYYDKNKLYQVKNMSLEDTKEKRECRKRAF